MRSARVIVGLLLCGMASPAFAQGPDVRNVRPLVMLLVDTSGSMERLGDCVCTTPTCEECFPNCGLATPDRNRWSTVLEAMTGSWNNFSCSRVNRSTFAGEFDAEYFIPHFTHPGTVDQNTDGILDVYVDRVKFGLMTFDGIGTLSTQTALVTQSVFNTPSFLADSQGEPGMFSYGEPKAYSFPGCGEDHMLDNGARNTNATMGQLVSVGSDAIVDYRVTNDEIQNALLAVRPFGPTPIAGMLDDFEYYLNNDPDVAPVTVAGGTGDLFQSCRQRYGILLTDGFPNADMRGSPYNCDVPGYTCPYDRPAEIAARLCAFDGASDRCTGLLNGLFVVGFDIADVNATAELNEIADMGGTTEALFATNREELVSRLQSALDQAAPGTTTRTVPAFSSTATGSSNQRQLQFNTGFVLGEEGEAWTGVLERRRFECNTSFEPEEQPIESTDRFHEILDNRTTDRQLLTVVPADLSNLEGHLVGEDTGVVAVTVPSGGISTSGLGPGGDASCGTPTSTGTASPTLANPAETGLTLEPFTLANASVSATALGVTTARERAAIIDWVHGVNGERDSRLGDIYHSSPVVVGPPQQDIADESFNLFRQLPEVENRPQVLYVGTNDGVLHAFATEDVTITAGPHTGTSLTAGEEIWGFVPPLLLQKLQAARASHQWMVDGSPVVREVLYRRTPGQDADGSIYHTVLVVGMRGGAAGYIALDVTDPLDPKFLWQYTHADMGESYGRAGLAQVLLESDGQVQERALALLPGGQGTDRGAAAGTCGAPSGGTPATGCLPHGRGAPSVTDGTSTVRDRYRCWEDEGRQAYFIDVATGRLIRHLDDRTFNAPLSGGVSFFTGEVGSVATRAFMTDNEGVIWRVDVSSTNFRDWTAEPLHDLFHDAGASAGQPAYFPPIVSTDSEGQVVIIQASGDVDVLDGTSANRVASLTEDLTFSSTGAVTDVGATLNWEIPLRTGEQVTGPLELFESNVFFATFRSTSSDTDSCAFGESQIWGVEYLRAETDGTQLPVGALEEPADSGTFVRNLSPVLNQVVLGVAVAQAPTCTDLVQVSETDPYVGSRNYYRANQTGGGSFRLVAQVSAGDSRPTGGSVAEITRDLPQPLAFTRVQGWAGSVD